MIIPDWYHDFWCPPEMREVDPQGCGIGLGLGAIVALLAIVAAVLAVVMLVAWLWPVSKNND